MDNAIHDLGVATQTGAYSDLPEARPNLRWLMTSGTPALSLADSLPTDITGQAEHAWTNCLEALKKANMTVDDIVKVTQYLTRPEDIRPYAKVRRRLIGDVRPAFVLLVVPQLGRPELLLEVEILAARDSGK